MKSKKITIWSTKGGVGKTSICAELHFRLGWPVVTNERRSMLRFLVDEKKLKLLDPKESIPNIKGDMLFDFGGYIDERVISAVKQSDYIIIPTLYEIPDIQGCIDTINSVKDYNKNIIVIINKISSSNLLQFANETLSKIDGLQIKNLNQSRAFPNIYKYKNGILDIVKDNPLLKFSYRKILKQFDDIMNILQ